MCYQGGVVTRPGRNINLKKSSIIQKKFNVTTLKIVLQFGRVIVQRPRTARISVEEYRAWGILGPGRTVP